MTSMTARFLAICALALLGCTDRAGATESEEQRTLYALGYRLASQVRGLGLSEAEVESMLGGVRDGALGHESRVPMAEYQQKVQALGRSRMQAVAQKERDLSQKFLDEQAAEEGATRTSSGLIFKEVSAGTGESPGAASRVRVHYRGTLRDGKQFDSSYDRGSPAVFGLNQVIPCWTEGLQLMKVGGKARIVCPSDIAYGDRGAPGRIPPGAALMFEVELLGIEQ